MRLFLIILVFFLVPACIQADVELPGNGFLTGWRKCGPACHYYEGILYQHINGAAELFNEFGFRNLTSQTYTFAEKVISIELYRMAQPESALGIF